MNWINNYTPPNYDPQEYEGGPYPWKYGGYDGYQGYAGSGMFPYGNRDMGYVNHKQSGVGNFYNINGGDYYNSYKRSCLSGMGECGKSMTGQGNIMGGAYRCPGCQQYNRGYYLDDGGPNDFNPFNDNYTGGLAWNLRRRRR